MTSDPNMPPAAGDGDLYHRVADGLLNAHSRLNANTGKTLESAAFLYALVELLAERGLITIDELEERKEVVAERLAARLERDGQGPVLQDPEYDKYTFKGEAEIDCADRLELCHAACCRLPFALSRQDIREGVIHWDLGQPYLIEQGPDGYCSHIDRASHFCTVRAQRPVPCRAYDCRRDKHIWLDFEARQINSAIHEPGWPRTVAEEGAAP